MQRKIRRLYIEKRVKEKKRKSKEQEKYFYLAQTLTLRTWLRKMEDLENSTSQV